MNNSPIFVAIMDNWYTDGDDVVGDLTMNNIPPTDHHDVVGNADSANILFGIKFQVYRIVCSFSLDFFLKFYFE